MAAAELRWAGVPQRLPPKLAPTLRLPLRTRPGEADPFSPRSLFAAASRAIRRSSSSNCLLRRARSVWACTFAHCSITSRGVGAATTAGTAAEPPQAAATVEAPPPPTKAANDAGALDIAGDSTTAGDPQPAPQQPADKGNMSSVLSKGRPMPPYAAAPAKGVPTAAPPKPTPALWGL